MAFDNILIFVLFSYYFERFHHFLLCIYYIKLLVIESASFALILEFGWIILTIIIYLHINNIMGELQEIYKSKLQITREYAHKVESCARLHNL